MTSPPTSAFVSLEETLLDAQSDPQPRVSTPDTRGAAVGRTESRTWATPQSQIPCDRYGHLMAGNEERAATLLDTYLTSASK